MIDSDYSDFQGMMRELFAAFPRFRMSDGARADVTTVWWRKLRKYGKPAVQGALEEGLCLEQFPSLGAMLEMSRVKECQIRGENARAQSEGEMRDEEKEEARLARAAVPRGTEAQMEYIGAADTEAERLARMWEVEDLLLGRVPWADTPLEKKRQRKASIDALLDRISQG